MFLPILDNFPEPVFIPSIKGVIVSSPAFFIDEALPDIPLAILSTSFPPAVFSFNPLSLKDCIKLLITPSADLLTATFSPSIPLANDAIIFLATAGPLKAAKAMDKAINICGTAFTTTSGFSAIPLAIALSRSSPTFKSFTAFLLKLSASFPIISIAFGTKI